MAADLTAYVPRLLLEWEATQPALRYRAIEGTLVFADVSGFTKLSERLARAGGKIGAEQMTDVINALFGELLLVAAARGGEMLKYGGDAVLLFFTGDLHATRAAAACLEMQRKLKQIGRIDTGAGVVRLRMSVGASSGSFDFFKVGDSHEELIVAGPATTECVAMEAAADAGEVLVSAATAEQLHPRVLGRDRLGGWLIRSLPEAPVHDFVPVATDLDGSKFLPPALRNHLTDGGNEPDHRLATVAFLHVMGLDGALAARGGMAVSDDLHRTLGIIQHALERHEVSFLATDLAPDGTKVMAAAGAPMAVEDNGGRVLQALREVVDADGPLPIRAGINRGHVFAGEVGPAFRRTYTVIGDVTNTAARVMGRAAVNQVLALRPVVDSARLRWDATEEEPFIAKGKRDPLVPFAIGACLGPRPPDVADLPMVGREADLRRLVDALTSAGGSAIEILAEPGIGKSRLVGEALRDSAAPPSIVLVVDELDANRPFRSLRLLVELMAGEAQPERIGQWVTQALEHHRHPRVVEALVGTILALPIGDSADVAALEDRGRKQLIAEAVGILLAHGLQQGAVLVIEDAHNMDAASAAVLGPQLARTPNKVILTRRPVDGGLAVDGAETLVLDPLSPEDTRRLAQTVLRGRELPEDIINIADRSEGSPLFLSALLANRSGSDRQIPESVESAIARRIDRLNGGTRRALRRLAVAGTSIAAEQLPVLGVKLDELELGAFLEPAESGVRFRHSLVRDVAYESLPYRERRAAHLALADHEGSKATPAPDLLAHHYFNAAAWEPAATFGRVAGDVARSKWANKEAAAFYANAIAARRRLGAAVDAELWEHLGFASLQAADHTTAARAFSAARRTSKRSDDAIARLAFWSGQALERRGEREGARRWYRQGARVSPGTRETAKWRVRNLISLAILENIQGRGSRSIALAEEAAAVAREHGDDPGLAHAASVLFVEYMGRRDPRRHEFRDVPLRIYEAAHDPLGVCNVLINTGLDDLRSGAWTEADERFDSARRTASECGATRIQAIATINLGELRLDQGRIDEAKHLFESACELFEPLGDRIGLAAGIADLGRVATRSGDSPTAIKLLQKAAAAFRDAGAPPLAYGAETWEAAHHCLVGDANKGTAMVERLVTDRRAAGADAAVFPALHRANAVGLLRAGRPGGQDAIDQSIKLADSDGAVYETALSIATARHLGLRVPPAADSVDAEDVFASLGVVRLPPPLSDVVLLSR